MRKVQRSALVRHSADAMYSLVDDIESYPEFLPWCRHSEIHFREGPVVEATLDLHRGELSRKFRTRNTAVGKSVIDMQLVDGPFNYLVGRWTFTQLGDSGSKVALNLEFEFSNRAVDLIFGAFFEEVCNSLVEAFTRRADAVFSLRASAP
ncbi:MAG: type II toxin-antitoxin system RatA family toxin [Gammaproteobacteria bacterium]|nr:type II toxin-antitoxin system RatA family toxin [Gammaproteobacteria bacterium]MDH5303004.1 type II toxin-antitoxin system RatA family toxin [Gammaproteobacteria bacterium]MDH5321249.1 type II toxin-antitoxin system RatA family toxin [Gammaproteobacteria bacterium]